MGLEIVYRWKYTYTEKGIVHREGLSQISPLLFHKLVREGRKLVLFNDYVIDIEPFMDDHPGTRFVLNESIGTDIGKFFYGAYAVEDDIQPHTHSSYAAGIIQKLTIAKLNTNKGNNDSKISIKSEGKSSCRDSINQNNITFKRKTIRSG